MTHIDKFSLYTGIGYVDNCILAKHFQMSILLHALKNCDKEKWSSFFYTIDLQRYSFEVTRTHINSIATNESFECHFFMISNKTHRIGQVNQKIIVPLKC